MAAPAPSSTSFTRSTRGAIPADRHRPAQDRRVDPPRTHVVGCLYDNDDVGQDRPGLLASDRLGRLAIVLSCVSTNGPPSPASPRPASPEGDRARPIAAVMEVGHVAVAQGTPLGYTPPGSELSSAGSGSGSADLYETASLAENELCRLPSSQMSRGCGSVRPTRHFSAPGRLRPVSASSSRTCLKVTGRRSRRHWRRYDRRPPRGRGHRHHGDQLAHGRARQPSC